VKGLIEGLDAQGPPDPQVRASVRTLLVAEGLVGVQEKLRRGFPAWWEGLADPRNPRRVCRALEQALSGIAAPVKAACPASVIVGLTLPPTALKERIGLRVQRMYQSGLLEEVERLRGGPGDFSVTAAGAIGYAEAMAVMDGELSREDAMQQTALRTRRLAKRQRTWFRHQANVHWVDVAGRSVAQVAAEVRDVWRQTGPTRVRRTHA
jgi:tRNA dimethylallyltransferase